MSDKKHLNRREGFIRKALGFERTLHRWDKWLDSINHGRKVLQLQKPYPSLQEMRDTAQEILAELGFPHCSLLELYWLCCVFCDYWTKGGFMFEKLIPPDWFPFPYGFEDESSFDFRGKRIYPPEVWDQADLESWKEKDPFQYRMASKTPEYYRRNANFTMVLSSDHPVLKLVKKGNPTRTKADGETLL